jgi:transcriptional regulator with XRE-family HTH domain
MEKLMARTKTALNAIPADAGMQLQELGNNLRVARKRRGIPQSLMAERLMISTDTLQRMERGDPSVSIGTWASALWLMGAQHRLSALLAPAADAEGLARDLDDLPERIHEPPGPGMQF